MANLAEAVDATETDWIISAELSDAIDYLTVESEVVKVTANFPAQRDPQTRIMQVPRIRVERGAGGTTAVSHADATALTPLIPPASSGGDGGVTIDNQSDPPFPASTLVVGAIEGPTGTATLNSISDEDSVTGATATVNVSAPEDDGSAEVAAQALAGADAGDGSLYAHASAGTGAALVSNLATSVSGTAAARLDATSGTGDSESRLAVISGATVLAGVTARHVDGVGDSLDITDGNGVLGSEASAGAVLVADAAVGSAWTVVDPLTSATDIIIAAGIGMVTFGADGSVETGGSGVVRLLGLPTADPVVAGQLWNDAGTLKVSAG